MADKTTLEQMLEHLVNDDSAKAEELFHEYVVTKSREIYENLIEEEMKDEEVDEASKTKKQKTKKLMKHLRMRIQKKTKLTKRLMKTK